MSTPQEPTAPVVQDSLLDSIEAQATETVKRWWKSRTILINAIAAVLLVAESKFDLLQPYLPVNVYAIAAFALPIVNTLLRFATTTAVR